MPNPPSPPPTQPPAHLFGHCACSAIHLRVFQPPSLISHCTCRPCRLITGAAALSFGAFPNDSIVWSRGEVDEEGLRMRMLDGSSLKGHSSSSSSTIASNGRGSAEEAQRPPAKPVMIQRLSDHSVRGYCAVCRTPLYMRAQCQPEVTHLCVGLLEVAGGESEKERREFGKSVRGVERELLVFGEEKDNYGDAEMDLWGLGFAFEGGKVRRVRGCGAEFERLVAEWRARGSRERGDVGGDLV